MAEVVHIAAPRPGLIPLFLSTVCIGAAGFILPPPESFDPSSIAYLLATLLAFKVGLVRVYVAVAGVPLRPVYAQILTKVLVAASLAALLFAPPPARLQPAGSPAPIDGLVAGRPKPLLMYYLSPVGSPRVAENTVVGHPESFIVDNAASGSPVEAVSDRVTGSPLPSFVSHALIGNTEATEDLFAVCAVPSSPNIALIPLFCEMGNRGEGDKEVI